MPLVIGHSGEDTELGVEVCVDCHDRGHIATSVAIVGRRPDRHDGFLREVVLTQGVSLLRSPGTTQELGVWGGAYLVAFVYQLVGSGNGLEAVDMVELGGNLITEQPPSATWTHGPCIDILGVAPNQVAECTLVRNLLGSGDDPDLINSPDLGAEATVHTQNGPIHNGGKDEEVEHLAACLPNRGVAVLCLTFFVEPIDLGNLS